MTSFTSPSYAPPTAIKGSESTHAASPSAKTTEIPFSVIRNTQISAENCGFSKPHVLKGLMTVNIDTMSKYSDAQIAKAPVWATESRVIDRVDTSRGAFAVGWIAGQPSGIGAVSAAGRGEFRGGGFGENAEARTEIIRRAVRLFGAQAPA